MNIRKPIKDEELYLADIRARAMYESLSMVGRYDEQKVRNRFLDNFSPNDTHVITHGDLVIGFYVVVESDENFNLKHLYIDDSYRSNGIGKIILDKLKCDAWTARKTITLNALVGSRSNQFYSNNGFAIKYSDGIDNLYEWNNKIEEISLGNYNVQLSTETIEPEIYNYLRQSIGWTTYDLAEIKAGLDSSLFTIQVCARDKPIGMGRVIGDGKMVFYIQDLIVLPQYQKNGIGSEIMQRLLKYIDSKSVNNTIIGLMSAVGKENFYEQLGFMKRPNDKMGCGMSIWVKK